MVELKVGSRLILNDNDWKVNVFEVVSMHFDGEAKRFELKQVKGRM